MAFRFGLLVLVVAIAAMAMAVQSSDYDYPAEFGFVAEPVGHGLIADSLEFDAEMMMGSDIARRQLWSHRGGYISYGAMGRNRVPCNQRGRSYYNCRGKQRANPYERGCTRITRCARRNH